MLAGPPVDGELLVSFGHICRGFVPLAKFGNRLHVRGCVACGIDRWGSA